jgi:hypothetical protein
MIANGTIKTIEDEEDIYISLTSLCDYFTQSAVKMKQEVDDVDPRQRRYAQGLMDMMFTIADEMVQLGKFEAQRRMIDTPQDIIDMVDKFPFGKVE